MQESEKLDNQQAIRDLGWLAGILDGEGSIVLGTFKRKEGYLQTYHDVRFYNSDEEVINKVVKILDMNGIKSFTSSRLQYGNLGDRQGFTVAVSNNASVVKLLEAVKEDLTCKKARAELVLRFCKLRLEHKNRPNTDEENNILEYWKENIQTKS